MGPQLTRHKARDYFCGAGGATRGLAEAGFEVVGYDNWPVAVATHCANGMPAVVLDLSDPAIDELLDCDADLAWFSSPCQPFSSAGDGEGEFDERDGFPWALRILAHTMPKVAIFENVKGLTFEKHRPYLARVLDTIRQLGYRLDWNVLNTADYGVPQTRERCIIIARRDGGPIVWPTVTHTEDEGLFTAKWVSMATALGWGLPVRPAYTVTVGSKDGGSAEPIGSSWVRDRLKAERDSDDPARWELKYTGRGDGMIERHGDRPGFPLDGPAPTVTRNAVKDYEVLPADEIAGMGKMMGAGMVERHGDRPLRTPEDPAFTIRATGGGNASGGVVWVLNTGRDWPEGGERDDAQTLPLDGPAPTVAAAAGQWQWRPVPDADAVVSNGNNTMKVSRDAQDMVPYERSIQEPAPTVDTKAAGAWQVGDPGHRQPPMSWIVRAGGDANATERSIDAPAPTVLGRKDPNGWTVDRPATTIQGDDRVFSPGSHMANDGRDNTKAVGRSAEAIRLTIPELATLQDFPPDWIWTGNKTEQARQVGNAVPRTLARLLAEANRPLP